METEKVRWEQKHVTPEDCPEQANFSLDELDEARRPKREAASKLAEMFNRGYDTRDQYVSDLHALCAASYRMAGCFGAPAPMLDNLVAGAQGRPLPHEPRAGLPVVNTLRDELENMLVRH